MSAQVLAVAVIVPTCALYAGWLLVPAGLRRRVARWMLGKPLPRPLATAVRRAAADASGCGCDGCDGGPSQPKAPATAPITVHRRRP